MTSEYRNESHLGLYISVLFAVAIVVTITVAIYYQPIIIQKNLEHKEWRENATCQELSDYLVENVDERKYTGYQKIEKIWEIKCNAD